MSNIGGIPPSLQTLAPSYAPLGKPAAGLESPENKDQTLPPVEETGLGEKTRHQPRQKVGAVSADLDDDTERSAEHAQEPEQSAAEPADGEAKSVAMTATPPLPGGHELPVALQRAAALQEHGKSARESATAVDSFSAAAGRTLPPGLLLDQRS